MRPLAIVQAMGDSSYATGESLTNALVRQARSLGCDAVVRVTVDTGRHSGHAAGVCVAWDEPK